MSDQKHLTLSDRTFIEQELVRGSSFKSIARVLNKDPSTISKEVKQRRNLIFDTYPVSRCRRCMNQKHCRERNVCPRKTCAASCRYCHKTDPTLYCTIFTPWKCDQLSRPPYVCNACHDYNKCTLHRARYIAIRAQKQYESTISSSRQGINMTPEELQQLNDLISPLVLKGQPLSHIFAVHAEEIPVCRRTLYNYFDRNVFKAKNIDLPRKVRYKKRKKRPEPRTKNYQQTYRNKRTYVDFEKYTAAFPDLDIVEMDTVKGSRNAGKCLLTLLFRSCSFMIIILLPNCTQKSVIDAINNLCDTIGIRTFKKYLPIILTDNGSEFKNPWDIEKNESGTYRTRVFYCDPYVSNQKGRLEKNHEYIRYVIPKGRSMQAYTQADINLLASHINSTARDSLNGATPFDLANLLLDKKIPILTGQFKVSPDDVLLKPVLLKHRD
ncbi:MAG: IS30 family transposase [Lachnospiraceae bacterium]|nr:IS30 family transposase [Lachnospiraceae bacterium]